MIKAIFFDCDGTLLSHRTNQVPASAVKSLQHLRHAGVKVILSTGRHRSELKELTQLKDLSFDGYITVNGASCYTDRGRLLNTPIPREAVQQVYAWLQKHELPVQFFLEEDSFISCVNDTVIRAQERIHTPVPPTGDLNRILSEPVYLMVPFGIKEARPLLETLQGVSITTWNEHDALDVVNQNAGKAAGVQAFAAYYGLQKEELMAFGDAMNDRSMLEAVGTAVVMGNGDAELKSCADYVTGDIDDDGLFQALKQFDLITEEEI